MSERDPSAPEKPASAADAALEPASEDVERDAHPPADTQGQQRGGGGTVLGGLALVIALSAVAASAYLWFQMDRGQQTSQMQQQLTSQTVGSELKSLNQNFAFLKEQLTKVEERQKETEGSVEQTLKETVEPVTAAQAQLADTVGQLTRSVEKVYADLDRSLDSWALEEVEQLLRIANHSAALSRDPGTALAGLELADERLEALADPRLAEVRALVAEEITQLQAVKQVDTTGLALKLKSMTAAVEGLPLANRPEKTVGAADEPAASGAADPGEGSAWLSTARELWSDLKSQVRIQNTAQPAKPLLAPEQRYFLTANLRLMLESAQIALLKTDPQVYQSNLDQARTWLTEYFDVSDPGVASMIEELAAMADVQLRPEIPQIDRSLSALKKIKGRT